jgi:hypothetical protein
LELYTKPLEPNDIVAQVAVIATFCVGFGVSTVEVTYGWNCRLDIDDLYKPHAIPVSGLSSFIQESMSRGVYPVGDADLYVREPGGLFEFRLCDESDLHFSSENPELVEAVRAAWAESDFDPKINPNKA